jgi:hypothetical protein
VFPLKCGNWVHLPLDIPESDSSHTTLKELGFRYGRLCKKNDEMWRHVHPPKGWSYGVEPGGSALLWDRNGHKRVNLRLPLLREGGDASEKSSHIIFCRYHNIRAYYYKELDVGVILVDLCDPNDNVVYSGFRIVPLDALRTQHRTILNIKQTMWEVYAMFLRAYPKAVDPFAYWDVSH